jgi:hypothetical protein
MVQASCSRPAAIAALRPNTGGIFGALCATESVTHKYSLVRLCVERPAESVVHTGLETAGQSSEGLASHQMSCAVQLAQKTDKHSKAEKVRGQESPGLSDSEAQGRGAGAAEVVEAVFGGGAPRGTTQLRLGWAFRKLRRVGSQPTALKLYRTIT